MIDVIYESYNIARQPILFGDQVMLRTLFFNTPAFKSHVSFMGLNSKVKGAIVNLSLFHNEEYIDLLNADLRRLDWVLLVLTSNEFGSDAYKQIKHPNMKIWLQTPKKSDKADLFLPIGFPTEIFPIEAEKKHMWMFAGQVTNDVRRECVKVLKKMPTKGLIIETQGFNQGLPHEDYLRAMAESEYIICPSGPATPDTYRVYEALELERTPIVDSPWYWNKVFGKNPLPKVEKWNELPDLVLSDKIHAEVRDWWKQYKLKLDKHLSDDIAELRGKS